MTKKAKQEMFDLLVDFHETVAKPTMEMLIKDSEKRITKDLGGRLDKVEERLDGVEERLDGVEEKIDNLGKKFDVMKEELYSTQDAQDKRLERLDETVGLAV